MAWRNPIRVALLALAVALVQVQAQQNLDKPLLTIPLHKDGEQYALLDFFSADPAHIRATTDQFCGDHGFSEADRQMIIRHATAEISKVQRTATHAQLPEVNGVSGQGPAQPAAAKPATAPLLAQFMRANGLSAADVLHALADTL